MCALSNCLPTQSLQLTIWFLFITNHHLRHCYWCLHMCKEKWCTKTLWNWLAFSHTDSKTHVSIIHTDANDLVLKWLLCQPPWETFQGIALFSTWKNIITVMPKIHICHSIKHIMLDFYQRERAIGSNPNVLRILFFYIWILRFSLK